MKIKIVKKSKLPLPKYKTDGASGLDLYADIEDKIVLKPMERKLIPTGIHISLPEGYEAQIRARSGLAINHGIGLVNGIGTIDSDYRGEIKVILINWSSGEFIINRGDRIAQMVITKIVNVQLDEVESLDDTQRGEGGFGHTGM
ncbi:dUTP diphosphatase [Caldisalinibacter kiritimatiensis]|uniref:Deoxyuridine 5'-triphosphate nucleotidohydrolase n=1 Tax=Caldisalinibacter kiritimatiensis TaxID=1304284 RepID=R1AVE9_9FIRM|nr:dUTP diphosphatase [Caldisalinibacter kiritimatiensis]EOD00632.1 Deoxyuridine 5'-triphosphate nucleotidohydrolase [Caldisalinibacter kiritimatiensis]